MQAIKKQDDEKAAISVSPLYRMQWDEGYIRKVYGIFNGKSCLRLKSRLNLAHIWDGKAEENYLIRLTANRECQNGR